MSTFRYSVARHASVGALLLLVVVSPIFGSPPAEALIGDVHIFGPATRMEVGATMEIFESGTTQERELEAWFERNEGAFSLFVEVTRPPFLRNMKFLLLREGSREESWMRTSRGVRRIGSSNGEERVFGSHFSARDFSRIDPGDARISYAEEPTGNQATIDVRDSTGAGGHRRFYIDIERRLIEGITFYDRNGDLVKEYELLEVEEVEGNPVPRRARMAMSDGSGSTTVTIGSVSFPRSIPRRYFSRGNL